MTDAKPIFISYARKESSALVEALVTRLGPGRCFVDRSDIEVLAEFPKAIVEAMLGARVIVAILGPRYPKSWYCWREWLLALAPYEAELQRSAMAGVRGTAEADARLADASSPLVVALHPDAEATAIGMIPPELSRRNLPKADDPSAVVEAVERVLARSGLSPKSGGAAARVGKKAGKTAAGPTLGELYERFEVSTPTRDLLLDRNVLPSVPRRRGTVPAWPVVQHDHQGSLGDDFVGRAADFWRLHHALSLGMLDGAACITALLSGGGGYGKTRLALEYFHRMGPLHYPGGNFIVDAAGDAEGRDLNSQLGEIDRILREKAGTAGTAAPAEVRESLSRSLCDAATRGRILYLVDNLPDTGNQGKIEDYCPAAKEVSLVFTSRREVRWSGVKPVPIETLARQESIRLLQRHLDRPKKLLTDGEWDSLAEAVGDLPLVLEILNATLREGLRTAKALHRSVVGGDAGALSDELATTLRGVVPEQSLRGISEAFRASLAGLVDPAARELLLRAAWLAPAPIPMELLDSTRGERRREGLGRAPSQGVLDE